MSNPLTGSDDH